MLPKVLLCKSPVAAGMALVDLTDTEMLEECGVGRSCWTLSAKGPWIWWLGKFEQIGTLHGHDVLKHTGYIDDVICCYNDHEGCWQIQCPYEVLMVAKEWFWHIDWEVHSCPQPGVTSVLMLPDDEEEIVQPKKKIRLTPTERKMPKVQPKKKFRLRPTAKKMPMVPKGPKPKSKDKAKVSAAAPQPVTTGDWMNKYRALAAAVQTDWAEAQRLVHEVTSDEHGFHASILLMSAILRDNRGDALAMSSLLG